ncbi:MAG: hypothetical protein CMJ27_05950 [Phycisphaerae bacterium]|nr:hypothetical protein [Phycisphaerae bacterium]OUX01799.1 MAG: hypothetical protein CBD91_03760 [Phycisphaeraceae bacterium TMED231]
MTEQPRILLIRPSALGDVFRSVPLVASLSRAFPETPIDWVVQEEFSDAIRAHPAVSRVIGFPRRRLQHWWRSPPAMATGWRFFRGLRGNYAVAIDAQGLARSGLMAFASGARRRIGFADASEGAWLGYNARIAVSADASAVDRMLGLLEGAGIEPIADCRLRVPEDAESGWSAWRSATIGGAGFVAIAPTSRWTSKEWPEDHWRRLVEGLLVERLAERIVLLGAASETDRLRELAGDRAEVVVMAGAGPLAMSMAAVRDSALLVANDSAMLHAAVGFDVPLVGLFGPTDPVISGPYGRVTDCIASPLADAAVHYRDQGLGDRLMRAIPVDEVLEACRDRLTATRTEAGT